MGEQKKPSFSAVLLFDGHCELCNGTADLVMRYDSKEQVKLTALQKEEGQMITKAFGIDTAKIDSVILVEKGKAYAKSAAAEQLATYLRGYKYLAFPLKVLPRGLKDWGYDLIAKYRYKMFGKREICRLPTPEERARFLQKEEAERVLAYWS